ncbi:MAG: chromate efflux transporter [Paracoccaceae bacterium]
MTELNWTEMTRVFGRIGLMSFGGPAAQIAVMHRELVEERPLLTEDQFLHALSFCMLLPGPEAMQLATYAGWKLRGVPGGLLAGLLFVVPGALVMLALALAYSAWGNVGLVQALFLGVKAAVVMIVIEALLRVAKKSLKSTDRWAIAGLAFVGIFFFAVPFPLIIALAALYGAVTQNTPATGAEAPPIRANTLRTVTAWAAIWWAPVAVAWATGAERLTEIGLFFSKLAVVTFGGAYAVLAYMTQEVVAQKGWLTTAQMVDGLGLAETTPGPLILVTEFVGYLAGFGAGGVAMGVLAALMTLWVTFTPCFLWIFAGAPYLDWIATRPRLSGALSAITAAVVGVILNLSVWFAAHVFFDRITIGTIGPMTLLQPDPSSINFGAVFLAFLAAALLFRLRLGLPMVLALAAIGGAMISMLG